MTSLEMVDWETMWMSASNSWVGLCLSINKMDLDAAEQPQGARSCRGKVSGTGGVDQFAQVKDLVAVKACGSIHGGGLSFI